MKKKIVWESQHIEAPDMSDIYEDDDDDEEYSDGPQAMQPMQAGHAISTPFGIYSVDDSFSNPYKLFELWIGHTNFLITEDVLNTIIATPGVEVCHVITPYRFLVAPGKLFEWRDVAMMIKQRLCPNTYEDIVKELPEDVRDKIISVIKGPLKDESFWRLYIFPNGELYHKPYSGMAEFTSGHKEFDELKELSNGIILTSG